MSKGFQARVVMRIMVWRWWWTLAENRACAIALSHRDVVCTCKPQHGWLRTILHLEFKGPADGDVVEVTTKALDYILGLPGTKCLEPPNV